MKLFFLIIPFLFFNSELLDSTRELYKEIDQEISKIDEFNLLLSNVTFKDKAPLVAYKGAGLILKARQVKGIKQKKELFVKGVEFVEKAIENQPSSVEARFVRLTIQENTPVFLGYKSNIEEDKMYILDNFKLITSKSLRSTIIDYVEKKSKLFSEKEKEIIFEI